MPEQTTAEVASNVLTYAKNAATAFAGQAAKLAHTAAERPSNVDSVGDFEAFMTTRALWALYHDSIAVSIDGNTPYGADKIVDRIKDQRRMLTGWLMKSKTLQPGLYGVQQHVSQEAARKFLADTQFVDSLDD